MGEGRRGGDVLEQLKLILERDDLIDEVGFLHPSQFATLNEYSGGLLLPPASIVRSADETLDTEISEFSAVQYDKTVFWNSNHKLAISTHALPQLYSAAMHAYTDASRSYKESINSAVNIYSFYNGTVGANLVHFLESEILKHTKVLLILSCDFSSAWNSRKLVLSRKHILSLFMDEFKLSQLILSYSPKSEFAWNHRRWVIKRIAEQLQNMQEIVEKESELVKEIVEKPKMNYRAWNHRCWLVLYMTKAQVLDELNKSRKWAELHVADNCCFHYRRRLMLRMLEGNFLKQDREASLSYECGIYFVWKEELKWNALLIEHYIGREALWVHRRFLSQCWIKHFVHNQQACAPHLEDHHISAALDVFWGKELQLLHTCLNKTADEFEDTQAQACHAAAYILWISKQIPRLQEPALRDKLRDMGELKTVLIKTSPDKTLLWESLLD